MLALVALRQQTMVPMRALSAVNHVLEDVVVSKAAAKRIGELKSSEGENQRLRLGVDSGGCSGFQYTFTTEAMDSPIGEDDQIFARDGSQLVVDEASLEFIKGSTIDYKDEMIKAAFVVANNPQSESACGCGSSFALKNFEENPALD